LEINAWVGKFSYPTFVELEKEKKLISSNEVMGLELVIGLMVGVQSKYNEKARARGHCHGQGLGRGRGRGSRDESCSFHFARSHPSRGASH